MRWNHKNSGIFIANNSLRNDWLNDKYACSKLQSFRTQNGTILEPSAHIVEALLSHDLVCFFRASVFWETATGWRMNVFHMMSHVSTLSKFSSSVPMFFTKGAFSLVIMWYNRLTIAYGLSRINQSINVLISLYYFYVYWKLSNFWSSPVYLLH